jgi:hypothetical protein
MLKSIGYYSYHGYTSVKNRLTLNTNHAIMHRNADGSRERKCCIMSQTFPYHDEKISVDDSKASTDRKKRVYILCTVVIVVGAIGSLVMIAGFYNKGGLSPTYDEPAARTSILSNPLDAGAVKGEITSHKALSPSGATIIAFKSSGFSTSFEKNGGDTIRSTISIDNTFKLDLPSGMYNLIVFYHDGTHDVIKNLAVWPNTTRTLVVNY